MQGVVYSRRQQPDGQDAHAVDPKAIPTPAMARALATELFEYVTATELAAASGRGGNRRPDAVGAEGRWLQPLLVAGTGLRNGELFALSPEAINLAELTIRVARQLIEPTKQPRYAVSTANARRIDTTTPR